MKSKTNVSIGEYLYTILYHNNDNHEIILMTILIYNVLTHITTTRNNNNNKKIYEDIYIRPKNKIIDFCVYKK